MSLLGTLAAAASKAVSSSSPPPNNLRIEPLVAVMLLAMAQLFPEGAKPSIENTRISYDAPNSAQWHERTNKNVGRMDLKLLKGPIKALKNIWGSNRPEEVDFFLAIAVQTINRLRGLYKDDKSLCGELKNYKKTLKGILRGHYESRFREIPCQHNGKFIIIDSKLTFQSFDKDIGAETLAESAAIRRFWVRGEGLQHAWRLFVKAQNLMTAQDVANFCSFVSSRQREYFDLTGNGRRFAIPDEIPSPSSASAAAPSPSSVLGSIIDVGD